MEYAHRMWGRSIGVAFFIPAVFFTYKGWISKALKPRLFIYGTLLGFQVISYNYFVALLHGHFVNWFILWPGLWEPFLLGCLQ